MKKVSIIGAGPAGNYLAYLLADKFKVEVYEEHKEIGKPIQCAGIVTNEFSKIIKPNKEFIINKTEKARVFAPNGSYLEIKVKPNYIIDRARFDSYLYKKAKQKGVKYNLGEKLSEKDIKKLKSDYIIGADGPLSETAKAFNLYKKRNFYKAIQVRMKLKNDNSFEFYPYVKDFAWVVPENKEIVRIGVASENNVKKEFEKFIKKFNGKIIKKQGGLIPIYNISQKFCKKNVFLLGDAALQVKATSGGGIIPGLKAAKRLSIALKKKRNYELLSKDIRLELLTHVSMRRMLNRFKKKDWNQLIKLCNQKKVKKILEIDREKPMKMSFTLLIKEPRLFKFFKYVSAIFIK